MSKMNTLGFAPVLLLAACAWLTDAHGADGLQHCAMIDADAERLACYDALARASQPATVALAERAEEHAVAAAPDSSLGHTWNLDAGHKSGTFGITAYRPSYFLFAQHTSSINTAPTSPAPGHSVTQPMALDATEVKFRISAKTKIWEGVGTNDLDLWFAYTQESNWQLYDASGSAPFRETNYEPELILTLRTDREVLGMTWRMVNFGFAHQSNGRANPLSRSWNRLYAQFGLERDNFNLLLRPWWRVPESSTKDDNPDIGSYLGNGDVLATYRHGEHLFSVLTRYSFSGRRGALETEWAFPLSGSLKGYLRAFSGYGENLIDYNHRQTTLGAGVAISIW